MSSSAPCSRQTASFSAVDAAAITRAPITFPSSTAARPTPPAAPSTSIVSPARSCATTSESGGPYSLQRTAFTRADSSSVTRAAALREILLVVFLGRVERRSGHDRGDDRPLEPAALLEPLFRRDGRRLLRGVVEE